MSHKFLEGVKVNDFSVARQMLSFEGQTFLPAVCFRQTGMFAPLI
jgi:hypothetical protein